MSVQAVSQVDGILLHNVPISHPAQFYPVLQLLRQQLVYNELLASCFGSSPALDAQALDGMLSHIGGSLACNSPSDAVGLVMLEVQYQPPHSIVVGFSHAKSLGIAYLNVLVQHNGELQVTIHSAPDEEPVASDALATKLLSACHHLPLTIYNLLARAKLVVR